MVRRDLLLSEEQIKYLQGLEGTVSEHIRRAIDEYIKKLKRRISASISPSKKGGSNG